jgi:hypothetical protein
MPAVRDHAPLRVDDLRLDVRPHAADGGDAPLQRVIDGAHETRPCRFGHAVGDRDLAHVHPLGDSPHHLDRTRGARHDAGA